MHKEYVKAIKTDVISKINKEIIPYRRLMAKIKT